MIAIDTETHCVQPGLLAPPMVCLTWADDGDQDILLAKEGLDFLETLLQSDEEIAGAHIAYDFACAAAARPTLLPLIFQAYSDERIFDVAIAQALLDIFDGKLFFNRLTMQQGMERYSLGYLTELYTGRAPAGKVKIAADATDEERAAGAGTEDDWRLRYAELENVLLEQWPEKAKSYAIGDARNTFTVATCQKAIGNNLDQMAEQAQAAWALHLAAVWGIRTDPVRVPILVAEVERKHQEAQVTFQAAGIYRENGKKDSKFLMSLVAKAFNGFFCRTCSGKKELPGKTYTCDICNGSKMVGLGPCSTCDGKGRIKVVPMDICPECAGVGNKLEGVPLTDGGGVKTDRDTLKESGNALLQAFAETGENETLWKTFAPILDAGTRVPINPETNVLVATGRISYRKPNLTNQPRHGGIRECYVPRPG